MRIKSKTAFFQLCIVLACILWQPLPGICQEAQREHKKDTTNIYKKIKRYAYKHKFTEFLYQFVFTEPRAPLAPTTSNNRSLSNKQKKKDPNAQFVGKTIRSIKIEVFDPFGHSVNDTLTRNISGWQKLGNRTHITTRKIIIRNILLFRPNEKVDILKITESERLLRQAVYINDARIYLTGSEVDGDSVDVKVMVLDRWSYDAWVDLTGPVDGDISFRDRNIAGLGHQFDQYAYYDFSTNSSVSRTRYRVNNIGHTYIISDLFYNTKADVQELGLSLNRPFYSPLTKWAGGISGVKTWNTFKYLDSDTISHKVPLDYFTSDVWLGRNFNPKKNNTIDNRSRNIGIAVRYLNVHFQDRPTFEIDTARANLGSSLYIGSLSYSVRKFYKDKYIYRFGANEDVPEGFLIQGLYGVLDKEQNKLRYYLGFEISRGKHFERLGYLSGSVAYGNYFNKDVRNNATINAGLFYFSNLLRVGRWNVRQFFDYKLVYGINKPQLESIVLSPLELYGFASDPLRGTRKMVLNLENVMYTPYNIIGFRFAPIVFVGFGMLDTEQKKFFDTQIYQTYGAGLLIRNENLIVNSLKITFATYPYTAGLQTRHFKLNPFVNLSLMLKGFGVGKPSPVVYQ